LCLHTPDIIHNGRRSLLFLFWLRLAALCLGAFAPLR